MATQSADVDRGWAWVIAAVDWVRTREVLACKDVGYTWEFQKRCPDEEQVRMRFTFTDRRKMLQENTVEECISAYDPKSGRTAAAFSFFVLGGYLKGFGIFFSAFLEEFDAPATLISLIIGVRSAVFAISAPIATSLCDRVTERVMIIISGLLHLISNVASSQARSLEVLVFANGVIGGLAVGTTFGPIQVTVGKYFRRRKALAMSLVFCGATLGQIVMSPVIVKMIEFYGLRGTLLLYGAFLSHMCITGMLARPIKTPPANRGKENGTELSTLEEKVARKEVTIDVEMQYMIPGETEEKSPDGVKMSIPPETLQIKPLIEKQQHQTPENGNPSRDRDTTVCGKCRKTVGIILDFSLCKSPLFVMYVVSSTLTFVPFINIMIFIFPRGIEIGLTRESAALLLTIFGGCELVGRFVMGILADVKTLGPLRLYIILTAVSGGMAIALAFCKTFTSMAVLSAFMGLCGSAPIVLSMPITVDIVTVPRLAKGLGFVAFFQGIFNTIAPLIIGLLKDTTGSYDSVFLICGGLMIVGSLVMVAAHLSRRCCHEEEQSVAVTS